MFRRRQISIRLSLRDGTTTRTRFGYCFSSFSRTFILRSGRRSKLCRAGLHLLIRCIRKNDFNTIGNGLDGCANRSFSPESLLLIRVMPISSRSPSDERGTRYRFHQRAASPRPRLHPVFRCVASHFVDGSQQVATQDRV